MVLDELISLVQRLCLISQQNDFFEGWLGSPRTLFFMADQKCAYVVVRETSDGSVGLAWHCEPRRSVCDFLYPC